MQNLDRANEIADSEEAAKKAGEAVKEK